MLAPQCLPVRAGREPSTHQKSSPESKSSPPSDVCGQRAFHSMLRGFAGPVKPPGQTRPAPKVSKTSKMEQQDRLTQADSTGSSRRPARVMLLPVRPGGRTEQTADAPHGTHGNSAEPRQGSTPHLRLPELRRRPPNPGHRPPTSKPGITPWNREPKVYGKSSKGNERQHSTSPRLRRRNWRFR
jgi:hypothetical protein